MKSTINVLSQSLILAVSLAISAPAFAKGGKACAPIRSACEAAGFVKGGSKTGKGLYKDCVQKIKKGETVPGVTVTPEQVSACQAKSSVRPNRRDSNKVIPTSVQPSAPVQPSV